MFLCIIKSVATLHFASIKLLQQSQGNESVELNLNLFLYIFLFEVSGNKLKHLFTVYRFFFQKKILNLAV